MSGAHLNYNRVHPEQAGAAQDGMHPHQQQQQQHHQYHYQAPQHPQQHHMSPQQQQHAYQQQHTWAPADSMQQHPQHVHHQHQHHHLGEPQDYAGATGGHGYHAAPPEAGRDIYGRPLYAQQHPQQHHFGSPADMPPNGYHYTPHEQHHQPLMASHYARPSSGAAANFNAPPPQPPPPAPNADDAQAPQQQHAQPAKSSAGSSSKTLPPRTHTVTGKPKVKKPPLGRTDISSAPDPERAKEVLRTLRARLPDSSEPAPSCDRCRRRKIRCDREKPSCGNCVQSGRACTQEDVLRKRGPPSKKERQIMEAAGIVFHGARQKPKKAREKAAAAAAAAAAAGGGTAAPAPTTAAARKAAAKSAAASSSSTITSVAAVATTSGSAQRVGPNGELLMGPPNGKETWNDILSNMNEPVRPLSHMAPHDWQQAQQQQQQHHHHAGAMPAGFPVAPGGASWDHMPDGKPSRPMSPPGEPSRRLFPNGGGPPAPGNRQFNGGGSVRSAHSASYTWDGRHDDAYGSQPPTVDSSVDWTHNRGASSAGHHFPASVSSTPSQSHSSARVGMAGFMQPPASTTHSWPGSDASPVPANVIWVIDADGELRQRESLTYYRSVSDLVRQWPASPVSAAHADARATALSSFAGAGTSLFAKAQPETPRSKWLIDRLISHDIAGLFINEYLEYQHHIHPFCSETRLRESYAAVKELAIERLEGRDNGARALTAHSWSASQLRHRQALVLSILAMTSCVSPGMPVQGGTHAVAWEYGHSCFHLALSLLAPSAYPSGWPTSGAGALTNPDAGVLERVQALAILGIYLANEDARENTREILLASWDTGRLINGHHSREVDAFDPRWWDDVDREMLKRSMWASFMMLQMVRLAAQDQRKGAYPSAEDVSLLDIPVPLSPALEHVPALDSWICEVRMDVILCNILDSPLSAPPLTAGGKQVDEEHLLHDTHLRESWAHEILGQLDTWASQAPCYSAAVRQQQPFTARLFNMKKSRASHQVCRSLVSAGLANGNSLMDIGQDARADIAAQHQPEELNDRVSAWFATTPSGTLRAMVGTKDNKAEALI